MYRSKEVESRRGIEVKKWRGVEEQNLFISKLPNLYTKPKEPIFTSKLLYWIKRINKNDEETAWGSDTTC